MRYRIGVIQSILILFLVNTSLPLLAQEEVINIDGTTLPANQMTIDLDKNQSNVKTINLGKNDKFSGMTNATDKFVQCNIKASWDDFRTLINTMGSNDFMYMSIASKMSEMGLFDLSDLALEKIKDEQLGSISINAMKQFYYPAKKMPLDDELTLAEIYSNIVYNEMAEESVKDLLKKPNLLSNYDYANYVMALGYYKTESYANALKYINFAIIKNPSNVNYQKLKAQILAEKKNSTEAIKIVQNLKKQKTESFEYYRKIRALEQFVLYKTKSASSEKNYHLGYYYHIENDDNKALKTLQTALNSKKRYNNGQIYALMSQVYLKLGEIEKAADCAQKAYKINKNYPQALVTLGDLSYKTKNYKQALKYYKEASSEDKESYTPSVREARAYLQLAGTEKAEEILIKTTSLHPESWEAYYDLAGVDNDSEKELLYLKKSVAINPMFETGWIDLAKREVKNKNFDIAQKYLDSAYYIDENDFRYYYYQGLINQNIGDLEQAKYNFKKCIKINSNFKEAQTELDKLLNQEIQGQETPKQETQPSQPTQDNI